MVEGEDVMRLVTLRSHDQYNTTIYAMDDRYRGVFGRRDVLFGERAGYGRPGVWSMAIGQDIHTALPGSALTLEDITVVGLRHCAGNRRRLLSGSQRWCR